MSKGRVLGPVLSEKSVRLGRKNSYAFWIEQKMNKHQVKEAIERLFKVKVLRVNVTNLKGKVKRFRRLPGTRAMRRKAIVTLFAGQKIPLFEEGK